MSFAEVRRGGNAIRLCFGPASALHAFAMDQVRYAVLLQGGSRDGEVVGVCLPFGQVSFVSEPQRGEVVNEIYAVTGQTASHPDHRRPLPVMRCVRCDVGLLS